MITGSEDMTALGLTQGTSSQEKAPVQEIVDTIGGKNEREIRDITCKGIECVRIMKEYVFIAEAWGKTLAFLL